MNQETGRFEKPTLEEQIDALRRRPDFAPEHEQQVLELEAQLGRRWHTPHVNPQGASERPRPTLAIGEGVVLVSEWGSTGGYVMQIKPDGCLRIDSGAGLHQQGEIVQIKGIYFRVTSVGPTIVRLKMLTAAEIEARKAAAARPPEPAPIPRIPEEPVDPRGPDGLTDSQRARARRKANRTAGRAIRREDIARIRELTA